MEMLATDSLFRLFLNENIEQTNKSGAKEWNLDGVFHLRPRNTVCFEPSQRNPMSCHF
jgi:hypothetical protein